MVYHKIFVFHPTRRHLLRNYLMGKVCRVQQYCPIAIAIAIATKYTIIERYYTTTVIFSQDLFVSIWRGNMQKISSLLSFVLTHVLCKYMYIKPLNFIQVKSKSIDTITIWTWYLRLRTWKRVTNMNQVILI